MSGAGDFLGTATPGRSRSARPPSRDDDRVEGRSLAALLAVSGPMPPDRAARLVDSIALGLQEQHRRGVAHGHLTPEHVIVLPPVGGDDARTRLVGFAFSRGEADPQSDQFALGAIAYEMLAGVPAFAGPAGRARKPPSIRLHAPDVNVLADEVVQRALSPDPDVRWADVYTFSTRLREAVDGLDASEEPTRLAPIPLTVSRPAAMPIATPTPPPIDVAIDVPVVASVDVDLGTPAPQQHASPFGGVSMNPTHFQPPRGPAPSRQYPIQPTPTFSFTDGPEPGPMWTQADRPRRRRSGGGFRLLVLMVAAGVGGYAAVRYHAWPELGPLVERAKDLGRSLRSLAPSAKPDPTPAEAAAAAAATVPATASPAAPATAPAAAPAPALHPEVIPIASPTAAPAKPSPLSPGRAHVSRARRHKVAAKPAKSLTPLSAEAAAEEALLASPH